MRRDFDILGQFGQGETSASRFSSHYFFTGLLGAIVLLTMALLLARTCRTHREHRNRASRREKVQTVLLQQRAEEEKYLP